MKSYILFTVLFLFVLFSCQKEGIVSVDEPVSIRIISPADSSFISGEQKFIFEINNEDQIQEVQLKVIRATYNIDPVNSPPFEIFWDTEKEFNYPFIVYASAITVEDKIIYSDSITVFVHNPLEIVDAYYFDQKFYLSWERKPDYFLWKIQILESENPDMSNAAVLYEDRFGTDWEYVRGDVLPNTIRYYQLRQIEFNGNIRESKIYKISNLPRIIFNSGTCITSVEYFGNFSHLIYDQGKEMSKPVATPDGKIVFIESGDIVTIDRNGENKEVLVSNAGSYFTFSHDFTEIIYNTNHYLYRINKDGTGYQQLPTNPEYWIAFPSYSHDDQKIVFEEYSGSGHYNLVIMNRDGTGKTQITTNNDSKKPLWSPVEDLILFLGNNSSLLDYNTLCSVSSSGDNVNILSDVEGYIHQDFAFSNDGTKIVYELKNSSTFESEIWIMNRDGSMKEQLTEPGEYHYPRFSPDDKQIVYLSDRDYITMLNLTDKSTIVTRYERTLSYSSGIFNISFLTQY